ncbi:MAG: hypothetical protein OEZ08_12085 [Betaproteobacteria bacterium]|nr:hypothetical protein [Betaproteobacteria bacterium]
MRIRPDRGGGCIVALVLGAASMSASGVERERRYELHEHGYPRMTVPQGWLDEVRQRGPQAPPTIIFRPLEGDAFVVLVTPIWSPGPNLPLPGRGALRERVERGLERVRPRAVEKEIWIWEFAGTSGAGLYFSATDHAPKPGEFTYLPQGMLPLDEPVVTFTTLSSAGKNALPKHTLGMLKTAVRMSK